METPGQLAINQMFLKNTFRLQVQQQSHNHFASRKWCNKNLKSWGLPKISAGCGPVMFKGND